MTLTVFAAFAARLADWQLLHGEEYRELAQNAGSITESSERIRGEILDKDGNGLVVNETRCRLTVDRTKIDNSTLAYILDLLAQVGEKWTDELPKDTEDEKSLCQRYGLTGNEKRLHDLISLRYSMEKAETDRFDLAPDLSQSHAGYLSERLQGMDGVEIKTRFVRQAVQPTLAPHLLGALGAISAEEYEALSVSATGSANSAWNVPWRAPCAALQERSRPIRTPTAKPSPSRQPNQSPAIPSG